MRNSVFATIAGLLVLFLLCSGQKAQNPPYELLFPVNSHILTHTAEHFLIEKADTSIVAAVEISNFIEKSEEIKVIPASLNVDFAKCAQKLIGRDFEIVRFEYKARYKPGSNKSNHVSLEFPVKKRLRLETFWESKEFKKAFANAVKDTFATNIKITVSGYRIQKIDISDPGYRRKFNNLVISRITLNCGDNDIILRALDKTGGILAEIPLLYVYKAEIDQKTAVPSNFSSTVFHSGKNDRNCIPCHQLNLTPGEYTDSTTPAISCFPCHNNSLEYKFMHGPAAGKICFYCHDGSKDPRLIYASPAGDTASVQCYKCHQELKEVIQSKKYPHGPVVSGSCGLCHDPHGSNYKAQLVMPLPQLCVTCHGEKYLQDHPVLSHPVFGVKDPLDSDSELSCVSCHHPHGSDDPSLIQRSQSIVSLCQECHRK